MLSFFLHAQEPVLIHLTDGQGLPDVEFYDVLEDRKGYIWLAADSGLYRYDGKSYKHYTNPSKRGLSVFNLFEDPLGRIWCTNISGQFFYTDNDKLVTFIDLQSELKGRLSSIAVSETYLIVTSLKNLYTIDLQSKKIINQQIVSNSSLSNALAFNEDYLLISSDSLWDLKREFTEKRSYKLKHLNTQDTRPQLRPYLFKFKDDIFYHQKYNNKNFIYKVNDTFNSKITALTVLKGIDEARINNIVQIDTSLWVLTNQGAFVYDVENGKFVLKNHFLKNENITKGIKDKDSNYWLTTLNNGLFLMPNIEMRQYHLPKVFKKITALDKSQNGALVLGTSNGYVGQFNLETKTVESYIKLQSKVASILSVNNQAELYVSTDNNSFIINANNINTVEKGFFNAAKDIAIINKDTTLYCKYDNAYFHIKSKNKIIPVSDNKRAYTVHYNKSDQTIYIGYVDGLIAFNRHLQGFDIKYKNKPILANAIDQTTDGTIWIATFKNGIFAIKGRKVIAHYNVSNGLLSNQIESLQTDDENLWVASSNGLQYFKSASKTFQNLVATDGILSYKISGIEVVGNEVFIASNAGLFSFDKAKVTKPSSASQVYFDKIEVNDKRITDTNNVQLDYNQNAIKIGFNVNGYQFNKKGTYKYRLLGYDSKWVCADAGETSVKYSSLSAGNYTFQVKAVSNTQNDTGDIEAFKFIINKPLWQKMWFITLCVFALFSLILFYFRHALKKKELARQKQIQELSIDNELTTLKLENLRSQMNPHFIFNALNSIQEYIILNKKNLASDYLGKFSDLIRIYLNHSAKGEITLQEEIDCLEKYLELEKLRFEDTLDYNIAIRPSKMHPEELLIPTMLVQPYVENAIKHGLLHRKTNRKLSVTFSIEASRNVIVCVIEDNGIGRGLAKAIKAKNENNYYKPFATKATQDRLNLLNRGKEKQVGVEITDLFKNEKPTGTRVSLSIPYTMQ